MGRFGCDESDEACIFRKLKGNKDYKKSLIVSIYGDYKYIIIQGLVAETFC